MERAVAAALALATLAAAGVVQAAAPEENPFGRLPIRVHLDASNLTGDTRRYEFEARAALRFWEDGGNGDIAWPVRFDEVASAAEADVRMIIVEGSRLPHPCDANPRALGCGGLGRDEDGRAVGFALVVTRDPRERYLTFDAFREVAAHEVGHALGLGHSARPGDVMAPSVDVSDFRGPRPVLDLPLKLASAAGTVLAAAAAVLLAYSRLRAAGLERQLAALPRALPPCTASASGEHRLVRRTVRLRRGRSAVLEGCRDCRAMRRADAYR